MATSTKTTKRQVRRNRIRSKVFGTAERPRLSVFKSNRYLTAQIIDDEKNITLASSTGMPKKTDKKAKSIGKTAQAQMIGKDIAEKAKAKKITKVVFDRGGYIYTGIIKTLADSAREGGLEF